MSFSDIADRMRRHSDERADSGAPRNFDELYLLRARILGVLIRDAREAAGLSLEACADRIGATPDTLEAWEYGEAMPSLPQIELLAHTLQVPLSHFMGAQTLAQQAEQQGIDAREYVTLRQRLIGAVLRQARIDANLTPEQLAQESGVTAAHVQAYELGRRPIPLPVLMTLASACGVNLSTFFEDVSRVGDFLALQEDFKRLAEMPEDMRRFVTKPVNQAYLELAMKLSRMSAQEMRDIAEAILNITL
ncbi:MAG: helix-turn-helix transcriptional regulator [Chloroflexota bacterium]|jgi:transcriptional regulator with XRE-family HTH domain|nr:transcriptional regulator [Anaerolineae bacterium]HMM27336.1 helix-turn-helix transcriptional regulator [Aggregatilineaceae bacterium]